MIAGWFCTHEQRFVDIDHLPENISIDGEDRDLKEFFQNNPEVPIASAIVVQEMLQRLFDKDILITKEQLDDIITERLNPLGNAFFGFAVDSITSAFFQSSPVVCRITAATVNSTFPFPTLAFLDCGQNRKSYSGSQVAPGRTYERFTLDLVLLEQDRDTCTSSA